MGVLPCDEIWSFRYVKQKNVAKAKDAPEEAGDVWTWTALDADTKLIVSFLVGGRDAEYAMEFMDDLRSRIENRFQITTDATCPMSKLSKELSAATWTMRSSQDLWSGTGRSAPLQLRSVHWRSQADCRRAPGRKPHFNQPCGAPEPHHAYVNAALHSPDQRFQQKTGKSHSRAGAIFCALQFLPYPQVDQDQPCDGRWHY